MRRAVAVAVFLLFPTLAAASATERYVVSLERGTSPLRGTALLRDIDGEAAVPRERAVLRFRVLDGFAADLTAEEAARLRRSPGVRYVEQVVERRILGGGLSAAADASWSLSGQNVPFGIDLVRARDVWSVTRGESVNVAVLDTGVDYKHPDLAGVWAGGFNTYAQSNDPMDDNNHGTHVAGTIAAMDNDFGVVGVAPGVKLWGVKVLRGDGVGSSDRVIAGIDWVIQQKRLLGGNWIINLSLGSAGSTTAEREAIERANTEGILIVAASGNESTATMPAAVSYPAAYPGVLAVGAVNEIRQLAAFSNQGPELALVAPGVDVMSTLRVGAGKVAAVQNRTTFFTGSALEGSGRGETSGEFVFCGIGNEGQFPSEVAGRIAVINRGEITFALKAKRAKEAGATAVIIVNNNTDPLNFTLIDPADPTAATFDWPITIALTQSDGQALLARPADTIKMAIDDYGSLNGTSMASPHAAGVAALAWALAPRATASQIRNALILTASDLGAPGFDTAYGHGLIDALEAGKMLNPAAFGLPSTPEPDPEPSGRRTLRRRGGS
ncbi:MAG TPA: S8 family serine peptidase [Thermoanaerobaculia bacterium]|nr:S8 family serine peptidase [Thermoanaerobaculia bacterium]